MNLPKFDVLPLQVPHKDEMEQTPGNADASTLLEAWEVPDGRPSQEELPRPPILDMKAPTVSENLNLSNLCVLNEDRWNIHFTNKGESELRDAQIKHYNANKDLLKFGRGVSWSNFEHYELKTEVGDVNVFPSKQIHAADWMRLDTVTPDGRLKERNPLALFWTVKWLRLDGKTIADHSVHPHAERNTCRVMPPSGGLSEYSKACCKDLLSCVGMEEQAWRVLVETMAEPIKFSDMYHAALEGGYDFGCFFGTCMNGTEPPEWNTNGIVNARGCDVVMHELKESSHNYEKTLYFGFFKKEEQEFVFLRLGQTRDDVIGWNENDKPRPHAKSVTNVENFLALDMKPLLEFTKGKPERDGEEGDGGEEGEEGEEEEEEGEEGEEEGEGEGEEEGGGENRNEKREAAQETNAPSG